jgi:hypothetical protein
VITLELDDVNRVPHVVEWRFNGAGARALVTTRGRPSLACGVTSLVILNVTARCRSAPNASTSGTVEGKLE